MPAALLAALNWALPFIAIHIAYWISIRAGFSPACIPYLDGCTSISAAARNGDALFLFRAVVIACSVSIIAYWRCAQLWLREKTQQESNYHAIFWLGTIGALFLILYADYLGSSGEAYRFMRRYGIIMFFGLTPLAQLFLTRALLQQQRSWQARYNTTIKLKILACVIMLACGLTSVGADWLGLKTKALANSLEWIFAFCIFGFFLLTAIIWRGEQLRIDVQSSPKN